MESEESKSGDMLRKEEEIWCGVGVQRVVTWGLGDILSGE